MNRIEKWFSELKKKESTAPLVLSSPASDEREEWLNVWRGQPSWKEKAHGHGLNLGAAICGELSMLALSEMRLNVAGGARAEYLRERLERFLPRLRAALSGACGCGGVMLKPYPAGKEIGIEVILPDRYLITASGADGRAEGCCFFECASAEGKKYLKIEEHRLLDGGRYRVTNRAFLLENGSVGKEVPLAQVKKWKGLSAKVEAEGVSSPLFAHLSLPDLRGGAKGRSVFADAIGLLRDADLQYDRLLWEFEGGELAIDASGDAFLPDENGKPSLPAGKDRLYRVNGLDAGYDSGELMKVFSPTLRDESLISGLNRILTFVEDAVGIARGTFSDPASVARTATEIRAMKQRTYTTVCAIRGSVKKALTELIRAMETVCSLYRLCPEGGVTVGIAFGDGVLGADDEERAQDRLDFEAGLLSKEEYRTKWHPEGENA